MKNNLLLRATIAAAFVTGHISAAVIYNNLTPNNLIGVATRPSTGGTTEIEAGDDFILTGQGTINSASFTGLIVGTGTAAPTIGEVDVEIYRVFPLDSNAARVPNVPTRMNSPSDVAFDSRDTAAATLSFTTSTIAATFTALNSIAPGGIHPSPNQTTGGNGSVTGTEVQFDVNFNLPFSLPADHYFFVPQVQVNGGIFYWLSASRPISGAGTTPITPDLQSWTRDQALDPDWLRVGMDIVGPPPTGGAAPTFNQAFSLAGTVAPEPGSIVLLLTGLGALTYGIRRRGSASGR
jgi:hypothetical protein